MSYSLQPTVLVRKAWVRVARGAKPQFQGRGQFFATAAVAMRQILVERERQRKSFGRGGEAQRVNLEDLDLLTLADSNTLVRINEALGKLAVEDPESAQLIELRFFADVTTEEGAETLRTSERTVRNRLAFVPA